MWRMWLSAATMALASCSPDPLPGSQVGLAGTSWSLESINGQNHTRTALRVTFLSLYGG
jgi:hypothetical protein